jgi:hypothetical protein
VTALDEQETEEREADHPDATLPMRIDGKRRYCPRGTDSRVEGITEWNPPEQTAVTSVVIVTYRVDRGDFEATLDALGVQTADRYEVIVVDNGTDWDVEAELASRDRCLVYAELEDNPGVTVARNIGAKLALGDLLVFLDDDGVPRETFVESHRRIHDERGVVAARGRVLPRTDTVYNRLQRHYDMGPETKPHFLNIEGNTSFDRETFLEYGGYSENLDGRAGHEGLELTYRMIEEGDVDREQVVYCPDVVIHHDYAEGVIDFVRKRASQPSKARQLDCEFDQLAEFAHTYSGTKSGMPDLGPIDYVRVAFLEAAIRLLRRLPRAR